MIQNMLQDSIPEETVMYLVNALAFDAQWETTYTEHQVSKYKFTTADGTEQKVEMMCSLEYNYLEDENAIGFLKYYADKSYAFAALLPNEGISLTDYVNSLNGEQLYQLLTNNQESIVLTYLPKFECEYSTELNDTLMTMGMTDAFDSRLADFSRMCSSGRKNISISRVLHKSYISVYESGTKAGVAAVVDFRDGGAGPTIQKTVALNRPFVYMLIDCQQNLPIFIGTLEQVNQ